MNKQRMRQFHVERGREIIEWLPRNTTFIYVPMTFRLCLKKPMRHGILTAA